MTETLGRLMALYSSELSLTDSHFEIYPGRVSGREVLCCTRKS